MQSSLFVFILFSQKQLIFYIFILNFPLPFSFISQKHWYINIFKKSFYENFYIFLEKVVDFYMKTVYT